MKYETVSFRKSGSNSKIRAARKSYPQGYPQVLHSYPQAVDNSKSYPQVRTGPVDNLSTGWWLTGCNFLVAEGSLGL